jgi:hypothetical protein
MSASQLAKATLMRLAQRRLEPTPENYARAWLESGGALAGTAPRDHWPGLAGSCAQTLRVALPPGDERAAALSREISTQAEQWREHGIDAGHLRTSPHRVHAAPSPRR